MATNTARPASAPRPAGRQPRTVATASTIVSASTASTSEARKAATIAGQRTAKLLDIRRLLSSRRNNHAMTLCGPRPAIGDRSHHEESRGAYEQDRKSVV